MAEHNLTDQVQNLYDATVYDQDGDKIGGVAQVYLDDHSGQPSWATVKTGWFGTKETFVPLDDATVSGEEIRVPYTKAFVKDAPNMDAETHLDEAEEAELYLYYSKSYDDGAVSDGREGVVGHVERDADRARADVDRDADHLRADVDRDADRARAHVDRDADHVRTDVDHARADVDRGIDKAESVVRHEEELHVGKERVATGRMRLRKHVVTEQKTVTVPVEREEFTLEREPITDGDARGAVGEVGEEEVSVTVHEERPVVEKEVVAKERVGLGKETVTEEREVTANVAHEEVTLDKDGVRGDGRDGVHGDARRDHDGNPLT